jgi:superfamily II DNA/RNA helicase
MKVLNSPYMVCNNTSLIWRKSTKMCDDFYPSSQKNRKLVDLLDTLQFNQLVIFVGSVQRAGTLNKLLVSESFPSIAFFGPMNPKKR